MAVAAWPYARPGLCGMALDRPRVMGIVNVTPDSFSDGGDRFGARAAAEAALQMAQEGADLLDIGGESTRPGAETVPEAEEIARVVPAIEAIRAAGVTLPISIDTRKAAVAAAALDAGADIVNDVAAMTYDSAMAGLVAERGVPICLMHAQGDPKSMQDAPSYTDVVREVTAFLAERKGAAIRAGIAEGKIILDPGIGFGKTEAHNLQLLKQFSALHQLDAPLLLGASRKRFIGRITGADAPRARMPGSLAVALHGAGQGAHFLRVHDVLATVQSILMWKELQDEG